LERVEALAVPFLQVRRLEDANVDAAILEDILDEVLLRVLLELLDRPVCLQRRKAHICVKAIDPALREPLLAAHPVRRARVPKVEMAIDHEIAVTVVAVHGRSSSAVDVAARGGRSSSSRRAAVQAAQGATSSRA